MRKLALVMAVAMVSGRAYALGLGDIELHSALNEPLDAEVRLLAEQPGELDTAMVRLAPEDEFQRAGIERPALLSDLNFTITRDKSGALIKITSTKPIREPFLDFVVQLRWQSGRLLREYTVLLDPPVFGEETAAPVAAPETAPEAPAHAPQSMPQPEPAMAAMPPAAPKPPAPAAAATEAAAAAIPPARPAPASRESQRAMKASAAAKSMARSNAYGPTKRNDTLWNIAERVRPDDSVSVYQMMIALLRENPEAFYRNNINNLMAGFVLRVPDKSVVAAVDQAAAVREAARQYEAWQRAKRGEPVAPQAESAAPKAGSGQTPSAAGAEEKARLRLVAPGDNAGQPAAGGVQAELDKLRADLALALETADSTQRENEALRSRVAALEEQIDSLQRLLALSNPALKDMQQRAGQEAPAAAPAPTAEQAPPAEAKAAPAKPAPAKAKPAPQEPAEEPLDLLANPGLVGALAGAALLLLTVIWLIVRRRRQAGVEEDESAGEPVTEERETADITIQLAEETQAETPDFGEEVAANPQMGQVAEEVAQEAEEHVSKTANDLDVLHTAEGDIDPIVEADVYLAYRRYRQAEALVRGALDKQPDNLDLQAKLLEIYYAAKNSDAFQDAAQALYATLGQNPDDPMWQRILPMGRELCPEHALFAVGGEEPQVEPTASAADSLFNEPPETAGQAGGGGEEFLDLDLAGSEAPREEKLDLDLNLGGESATPAPSEGSAESLGAALDFDGIPAATGEAPAPAAEQAESPASAEKAEGDQSSWEVESAMSDFGNIDFGLDDSDLLAGTDVVGTKLDLARAYIDMGDNESARDILKEVVAEGNEQQKQEATALIEQTA